MLVIVTESYRRNNGKGNCIDTSISLLDKAFYLDVLDTLGETLRHATSRSTGFI